MRIAATYFLFVLIFGSLSCSQPVLESKNCIASREPLKRLYSIHMDGGPNPDGSKLELLQKYLSKAAFAILQTSKKDESDYLTRSTEFPKAFRAGACRETTDGTEFDVILLWRRDDKSIEKNLKVRMKNENGWVVDSVEESE